MDWIGALLTGDMKEAAEEMLYCQADAAYQKEAKHLIFNRPEAERGGTCQALSTCRNF